MAETDQDIHCDAEGYSTNRERMAGGHPQNRNVVLQHGQQMPYNSMGSTAFGVPRFSGIPPEYEHFDVALLYAKDDYELASDIQLKMNSFELKNKMYPKICLYDDNNFVASQMCKAENVVNLCTLIFVVLTENIHDDMVAHAVREEAFGLTRLAPKDDCTSTKRYCIRPLHTKSEKDRRGVYKTPCGLLAIDPIDWFNFEKNSFKHRLRKLFEFHLPYRLKREQHGCGEIPFQTAQLHRSVSSDKQSFIMQSMQGHLQNGQTMYQPHIETPGIVQGDPPPAGVESENHRQSGAHGNISFENISLTKPRLTSTGGNTSSHNYAQPQGSLDQCNRIDTAHITSSPQKLETPSHGNAIHNPPELSNSMRQEQSQTDEQDLSINLSQIHVSTASAPSNRGGQEGRGSGNSIFEADAQPSRSLSGAQIGGLVGPGSVDTNNIIDGGCDDDLFGDGRSVGSQNVSKQDNTLSDKPSSAIRHSESFSEKSSEQPTAASSSRSTLLRNNCPQHQRPLNSSDDVIPSETFQPLPEDDLIAERDLDEDGTNATKSDDKLSESFSSQGQSSRLAKCEDEESRNDEDSNQGTNSSTDTTAIKDVSKTENRSVASVKLADVVDQGPCHNAGEDNDNKSGVVSFDITKPAPLTADRNPGMSPAVVSVNEGPCEDVTSVGNPNNGTDKVLSCQGLNGMDACDHGASNNEPRNHMGAIVSGQVAEKNLVKVATNPGAKNHLQKVASGQIQRNVHGKDDHASDSLTSGQKPSDDIDTVGPRLTPSNGSSHPPIASRTPGDGQSLTEVTVAKPSSTLATQTSDSDACKTVPVKTHMTSGSADHDVLDNATKSLEKDSALSEQLKTPLAKQGVEEVNKVLTHKLKSDGLDYRTASKCGAPNVVKSSMEVPPTSAAPVIHYHFHAGNQGPGVFDPSVFTPLEQHLQFAPLHVNGPPRYPGPPTQDPQQCGPVNMSQQAPINIVNCENVQIGTDGKLIIGGQRMTDRGNEDPCDSLTSSSPSREDSPPPYSVHNPSSPASTSRKTPLTEDPMIPRWTEPRGGNPPCGGQEAVTAGVSQSESESLGNASGLTRDGPRSCFPSERMTSEGRQVQAGFTDLQPHMDSASGLSDFSSFSVPEPGSANDFLEMVQSELSEDRDSSLTGKGETIPTVCSKENIDESQVSTENSCNPSTLRRSDDTFYCANKRRKLVYLNSGKTLLQQCDFQNKGNSSSVDSELD